MNIAHEVSTRSTCKIKHFGLVKVREKTILSTGYIGSIRGTEHFNDIDCKMINGYCLITTHAEANAIVQSEKNEVKIDQGDIYVIASPYYSSFKLIANAKIKTIFYNEFYRDKKSLNVQMKWY